jgi:hypothetical protein
VAEAADDKNWKRLNIAVRDKESGVVIEYKIHFYRKRNGAYDEIRYDSHEIRRGKKALAPHLHMKLATPFKDSEHGEAELKRIIEELIPGLREIIR